MAPPLVIPVFIPHMGCPHQCAFCNQTTLTAARHHTLPSPAEIRAAVDQYLPYKGNRPRVELAFYGGNFLGLTPAQIQTLLDTVTPYIQDNTIQGIRFSTRPDTITHQTLDLIQDHPVCLIELGVQSMSDPVLTAARRGHTAAQTHEAMARIQERNIPLGVQVMVGLPDDTPEQMIRTAETLAQYKPDTARIYPLLVLSGSPLALAKDFQPIPLDQAVEVTKRIHQIFTQAGTQVIRMGLQASDLMDDEFKVLSGPWHPAFGHLVFSALTLDEIKTQIAQLKPIPGDTLTITFHPSMESRVRGQKNQNLNALQGSYPECTFQPTPDKTQPKNQITVTILR